MSDEVKKIEEEKPKTKVTKDKELTKKTKEQYTDANIAKVEEVVREYVDGKRKVCKVTTYKNGAKKSKLIRVEKKGKRIR